MNRIPIVFLAVVLSIVLFSCSSMYRPPIVTGTSHSVLPGMPGDEVKYTFAFSSELPLRSFTITPDYPGANEDALALYTFSNDACAAEVDYTYVIPKKMEGVSAVTLTLTLVDDKGVNVVTQTIPIYNPPQFAAGMPVK